MSHYGRIAANANYYDWYKNSNNQCFYNSYNRKSLQNIQETSYRTLENIETITITYKCKCHHAIMISFKINEKLGECDKGHQCSIHQMLLFAYQMIAKVS